MIYKTALQKAKNIRPAVHALTMLKSLCSKRVLKFSRAQQRFK